MIDLDSIKPHKISTDLSSYCSLIYGTPKVGKTTFVHELYGDKMLLVATEKGYLGRAGILAVDTPRWSDFIEITRQLKKDSNKKRFKAVVIDTADLLYDMATKHILMINGVEKVSDIPYGSGYKMIDDLFREGLLEIQRLKYGLSFISHCTTEINEETGEIKYKPSLNKRAALIINKMVDIIGFAYLKKDENGHEHRSLYLRETLSFTAGTRFTYTPAVIPFDAKIFEKELIAAIEKQGESVLTDERAERIQTIEPLDYNKLMEDLKGLAKRFNDNNNIIEFKQVVENRLGKEKKISELVQGQEEIMSIIAHDLDDLANELAI